MQNENAISTQTLSELKSPKMDPLDKKIEQLPSSMVRTTLAKDFFTDLPNNDLSHKAFFPYLTSAEVARSAPTNRFFAAAARADQYFLLLIIQLCFLRLHILVNPIWGIPL